MATKFITPNWRMPRNSNQSKASNYSLDFDGSSKNIELSSSTLFDFGSNSFSFSAWVKRTSIGDSTDVIIHIQKSGSTPTVQVRQNARNIKIDFNVGGTWSFVETSTNPIGNDTNWHHLAVTKTGTSINIYFDGVLQNTGTAPTTLDASNGVTFIGARGGNTQNWDGSISQVSIFDYALSTGSISALYNNGIPSNPLAVTTPPIAYYDLGQGSAYASGSAGIVEPNLAQATGSTVFNFSQNKIIRTSNDIFDDIVTDSNKIGICTISYWFKNDNAGAQQDYMSLNDDNISPSNFRIDTSNRILYMSKTNYMRYPAPSDTGGWNHHCWVFNSNTSYSSGTSGQTNYYDDDLKFYLNGVEQQVNYNFSAAPNNTAWNGFNIAESAQASGASLNFEMSNLQLFNTNLSSANVSTLYNNGTPLQSYTDVPQSGSLKAWYKLGLDTSTWGGDGWINGDSTANYNKVLSRIESNTTITDAGSGDRVNCGNDSSLQITGAMSISLWFRVNTISPAHSYNFVMGRSRFRTEAAADAVWTLLLKGVSYGNPAHFRFKLSDGTTATNYDITETTNGDFFNNKWQNLIITYDGTTNANSIKAYLNSELHQQFTSAQSGINNIAARNLTFYDNDVYQYGDPTYTGALSNCAIWNKKLEASDISSIWNEGKPALTMPSEAELQGWWKFSDGTYNTSGTSWSFPDSSQNTNTGSTNTFAATAVPFDVNSVKTDFVSSLNGESSGMDTTNLIPSNLIKSIPYSGYSMEFHGTDDYITASYSGDVNACSIWFKPENTITTSTATEYLISFGNEYDGVLLGSSTSGLTDELITINNDVGGIGRSAYTASSGTISDSFHHLCFNWSGTVYQIWLDGVNVQNVSNGTPALIASTAVQIGRNSLVASTVRDFNGNISNVAIFDRTLTQGEIIRIYNGGSPGNLSSLNPTSWWSLGSDSYFNGSNWVCPDIGSNSNDGTSVNLGAEDLKGNGPDSLANGTSTNLDLGSDLVGNAPGSTGNAISVNMNFTARTGSTP